MAGRFFDRTRTTLLCFICLIIGTVLIANVHGKKSNNSNPTILVVGSVNADTFLEVARLPTEGENLTTRCPPVVDVPGGKGCTQAVAASKLVDTARVRFVGQFGNDPVADALKQALKDTHVDVSASGSSEELPSGRGYVLVADNGSVSAVVSGGSNQGGWQAWQEAYRTFAESPDAKILNGALEELLDNCQCIMLQREVPEFVNRLIASYAKRYAKDVIVLQDVGGEDRPVDSEMLACCDYLIPNESELRRLVKSFGHNDDGSSKSIVELAQVLQSHGAQNVLVTLGSQGSMLVTTTGEVLEQPAITVQDVVDETGAGDCYRAAFGVALIQDKPLQECMAFASAAGACSVQTQGAVPSTPSRAQVEELLRQQQHTAAEAKVLRIPRGDGLMRGGGQKKKDEFEFLIGSRLNSMKDRADLYSGALSNPRDYVARQATVQGLTCVDFNYPQHFLEWSTADAKAALDEAGLVAGAVCLRYPAKFARGAMNHPDPKLRQEAIDLTKEAAEVALALGCKEVVVWSAFDGYDYPFQVDYDDKWTELVEAFRECCDAFPDIKFSVEYKPTDENTRFFTIPSTGAALWMVQEVDRPNFGLTLDVGHMLMSGENPGQSIAMVGRAKKLFGIQLNDGYTRLAAEDGLMFGSVHPSMALEIMYQLRRTGFDGHFYFDTFPQRTDPVKEAEYNIRRVKEFWVAAGKIDEQRLGRIMAEHDAIGALEIANEAFRQM